MPRATARRILLAALAMGVLVDVLVPGNAAGINAPLVTSGLLAAAFAVAGREGLRRFDPADAWMPPASLALAAMAAVRADGWLVEADLSFAAALAAGTIAGLAGTPITRGLVPRVLAAAGMVFASALAGAMIPLGAVAGALRGVTPDTGGRVSALRARLGRFAPVLRGIALAAPIVILFALLFAAADAVFASVLKTLLDVRLAVDLADLETRVLVVGMVAWGAAGLFALAAGGLPSMHREPASPAGGPPPPPVGPPPPWTRTRSLGAASAAEMRHAGGVQTIEAATVLVVVDALFAAFVVLQLAYLFGGRDTLSIAGLTYAQYARRGFFELVAVAVLAGMLVAALDLAVARRSRVQLGAALALLGLTAVVLVSAFVRLRLYQDAYGWTELRFVVAVSIGWLAVALAVVACLLLTRRTHWTLHALGIMVLVTLGGMNAVGPQAFVADRNLERAIDPTLVAPGGRTGLDADYLASLGDEAIPAAIAAMDRLPAADRALLAAFLDRRAAELATDGTLLGWPSWNLTRERARDSLATWTPAR